VCKELRESADGLLSFLTVHPLSGTIKAEEVSPFQIGPGETPDTVESLTAKLTAAGVCLYSPELYMYCCPPCIAVGM
jgi:hypothetical protein